MSDTKINVIPEVPESVNNAIKNVTDLPTKGIGQTLSDCWFLAFGGISQAAEKKRIKYTKDLEKFKKELEESLETVPEQRRKEPTTQMVLKTLDEAKYCVEEDDLRRLFVALLTSATDAEKNVHPSFAQIIGQMSKTDATILQSFSPDTMHAICNLHLAVNEKGSFRILADNIFLAGSSSISPQDKSISISSLIRLGLLEIPEDQHASDDKFYEPFKKSIEYISSLSKYPESKLTLEKKIVRLTPLGKSFVSCCMPH